VERQIDDDLPLLRRLMADSAKQPDIFRPGPYWKGYSHRTYTELKKNGLEGFRRNPKISKGFADVILKDQADRVNPHGSDDSSTIGKWFRDRFHSSRLAKVAKDTVLQEFDAQLRDQQQYKDYYFSSHLGDWFDFLTNVHDLPETLLGDPTNTLAINGSVLARNYLHSFMAMDFFSKNVDFSAVSSVLEIGGGFGSFAHTLMHCYPNITNYYYVDISPNLYIGTQYLKAYFPKVVVDYQQLSCEVASIASNQEKNIYAIPPWLLNKVTDRVQCVVNSCSFQEMDLLSLQNYVGEIYRLTRHSSSATLCLAFYPSNSEKLLSIDDVQCELQRKYSGIMAVEEIETPLARYNGMPFPFSYYTVRL
jgi:putative sugar O-methyltransferase